MREGNFEGRGLQGRLIQREKCRHKGLQSGPGGFGIPFGKLPHHAIGGVEPAGRGPVAQQTKSEATGWECVIRAEGEGGDRRGGGSGPAAELRGESAAENRLRLERLCFAEESREGRQGFRNSLSIVDGNGGRFCDARVGVIQKLSGGGMTEPGERKDRNRAAADGRILGESGQFRRIGAARDSRDDGVAGERLGVAFSHAQQGGNRRFYFSRPAGKGCGEADTRRRVGEQAYEGLVGVRGGRRFRRDSCGGDADFRIGIRHGSGEDAVILKSAGSPALAESPEAMELCETLPGLACRRLEDVPCAAVGQFPLGTAADALIGMGEQFREPGFREGLESCGEKVPDFFAEGMALRCGHIGAPDGTFPVEFVPTFPVCIVECSVRSPAHADAHDAAADAHVFGEPP